MPLDDIRQLIIALVPHRPRELDRYPELGKLGEMHCPTCSEQCGMNVSVIRFKDSVVSALVCNEEHSKQSEIRADADPSLLQYACVNCPTLFYVLLYVGANGPSMSIFPNKSGGISTPQTPLVVKYYVDQAYRAQLAGAYSAAMAMYRTALDQLLEEQKFKGGLPAKITELEKQIVAKAAPKWAMKLNTQILTLIKEIGDSQMHASELPKLTALDIEFVHQIQATFVYLLHVVYEEDHQKAQTKARLKKILGKPSP